FVILAVLIATAALSPATATAWGENDATREGAYPPLWDRAPATLMDYPVKDNKIVINAWNYLQRLGMYKTLLKSSDRYFPASRSQNAANILWGLPLQHGWQFRTGRLADPSSASSCGHEEGDLLCISVRSWWSCMNYYLAAIPFLGAVEAGLFGQLPYEVEILPPEEQGADFCYSVADCRAHFPELMDNWKAYFEVIPFLYLSNFSFELDDALGLMWKAHVSSIAYSLPKFQGSLKYLPGPEATFGADWANAVDFIAATHFSTDFVTTNDFQTYLPQRMLVKGDVPPLISDFSLQQNRVLLSMSVLHKANQLTGGLLLKLWQKVMSTAAGREMGRELIENLASS
ncbi:LEG1H protein, partial [Eubucco bourcierii]|nr:LEG1H protein [Eubucco bourcierii]